MGIFKADFYPILNKNGVSLDEVDYLFGQYFCLTKHGVLLQLNIDFKPIKQRNFSKSSNTCKLCLVFLVLMKLRFI